MYQEILDSLGKIFKKLINRMKIIIIIITTLEMNLRCYNPHR